MSMDCLIQRRGQGMTTYSGRRFWLLDPRPDEIFIEDIAHSLSMRRRNAGHCQYIYSVVEHGVIMSEYVPAPYQRAGGIGPLGTKYIIGQI
ncbi:MAG: hypothetical protein KF874_07085 [Rhizobiaceae bacterium]|nr:hypothetical protein [Rhizobiaceae bacterium]